MLEETRSRVFSGYYEQSPAVPHRHRHEPHHESTPAYPPSRKETAHCRREFAAEHLRRSRRQGPWRERQPGLLLAQAVSTRLARTDAAESRTVTRTDC